ncbi:hypothetical protein, partial [Paraburkholderia sp. SIMBA_053]|uniref:hypothetical protein n=1 Tax=Paraburkholderia sp. SIMBA_053 TaxID=3085794 RepID=UPI003979EA9D
KMLVQPFCEQRVAMTRQHLDEGRAFRSGHKVSGGVQVNFAQLFVCKLFARVRCAQTLPEGV